MNKLRWPINISMGNQLALLAKIRPLTPRVPHLVALGRRRTSGMIQAFSAMTIMLRVHHTTAAQWKIQKPGVCHSNTWLMRTRVQTNTVETESLQLEVVSPLRHLNIPNSLAPVATQPSNKGSLSSNNNLKVLSKDQAMRIIDSSLRLQGFIVSTAACLNRSKTLKKKSQLPRTWVDMLMNPPRIDWASKIWGAP